MGHDLSLFWTIPFVGILLSIGLGPLLIPRIWHHHYHQIALGWAALLAVPFVMAFGNEAIHSILHIYLLDYVPFLILLGALFTISGGILVRGTLVGTPALNSLLLLIGTALASFVGTTGASMLLIRPVLRANERRRYRVHTIIFFIFLVSNVGGSLTPLGDPPLFLGFLHGVPFFWTMEHLWGPMLVSVGCLLALYFVMDCVLFARESPEAKLVEGERQPFAIEGVSNFGLLAGVIGGVLVSGYWNPDHFNLGPWIKNGDIVIIGEEPQAHAELSGLEGKAFGATPVHDEAHPLHQTGDSLANAGELHPPSASDAHQHEHTGLGIPVQNAVRDVILIAMSLLSLWITPRNLREGNGFSWGPIKEVAWLFAGIFMTIIPALKILSMGEQGAFGPFMREVASPTHYFWVTGTLSSFLDNAPTYLTFLNSALGRFYPGMPEIDAIHALIRERNEYLVAVSAGAVFMGANTYIGNAPNFMVKAIAEESGVRMPDFFSYIYKYSLPILIPVFVLVSWIYF